MKRYYFLLFIIFLTSTTFGQAVFINEIHYDNGWGPDVDEGFEIAGPAGTDLSTYHVTLYDWNGYIYNIIDLSGTIPDEHSSGYGTIWFGLPFGGLGNGPNGLALDNENNLIQFLSYEGSIMGWGGVAIGITSTDIGVTEDWLTPIGTSMQLTGYGTDYTEFSWYPKIESTHGLINTWQSFGVTLPTLHLAGLPGSGASIEVGPEDLNGELDYTTTNFNLGEPGTGTEGDGYIIWSIINITDGSTLHDYGFIYDSSSPQPFDTLLPDKEYYLSSTLADNEGTSLVNPESAYNLTVNTLGYNVVSDIASLRNHVDTNGVGYYYEITGPSLVTLTDSYLNRKFIQDNNISGIEIIDLYGTITTYYNVGDNVTGLKGQTLFNRAGQLALLPSTDSGSIESSNNPIIPQVVTIPQFNSNFEDYESEIIELQEVTIDEGDGVAVFDPGGLYHVSDADLNSVEMYIDFWDQDHIGTIIPSTILSSLVGLGGHFNNKATIYPRNLSDFILGYESYDHNLFSVYPNPTSNGSVNIVSKNQTEIKVSIYDILGKQVINQTVNNSRLDISALIAGIYIMKISQDPAIITKKLVVK
jgi:hypothetical protein